jgi:hypothetical protein
MHRGLSRGVTILFSLVFGKEAGENLITGKLLFDCIACRQFYILLFVL